MTDLGPQLAIEETGLMFITRRRIQTRQPIRVGTHEIVVGGKGENQVPGVVKDIPQVATPTRRKSTSCSDRMKALVF